MQPCRIQWNLIYLALLSAVTAHAMFGRTSSFSFRICCSGDFISFPRCSEMNYIMHSTKGGRKAKERRGKHKTGSDRGEKNALAEIGGCGHEQLAIESFLSCILFQVYLEFAAKGAWVVGAPWHSVSVDESVNLQKKVGDASTSAWSLWWRNLGRSDLSGPLHTCACGKHNMNPATFRLTAQRV